MQATYASASNVLASAKDEATPGTRTINQITYSLEQLEDTISSFEVALCPVLRHAEPEAKSTGGEVRETGQSPVHQTLLDMQHRIQRATQSICALRNRVTL